MNKNRTIGLFLYMDRDLESTQWSLKLFQEQNISAGRQSSTMSVTLALVKFFCKDNLGLIERS